MSIVGREIFDPELFDKKVSGIYRFNFYWRSTQGADSGFRRFEMLNEEGKQVALIDLDFSHDRQYWQDDLDVLEPEGPEVFEIKFLDVREGFRQQGIGRYTVHWLVKEFTGHQVVAFSADVDHFWESLGWKRFEMGSGHHPMYVSPLKCSFESN